MIKYMIIQISELEQLIDDIGAVIFVDSPPVFNDVRVFINRALKQFVEDGCFSETHCEDTAYFMIDIVPYVEHLLDLVGAFLKYHAIEIPQCTGIELKTQDGVILMYFGGVTHGDISRYQSV